MKRIITITLFLALIAVGSAEAQLKKVYNDNIDPMEQIDNALSQAKQQGKFVICQVGGNWCPWCLRFADFITTDKEISKIIDDNFVYIHVSYNPHQAGNKTSKDKAAVMLKRLGSPARFGFPVLVVLNHEGTVLHIQDSGYLELDKSYDKNKVLRFFNNWTPKAVNGK